MSDPTPTNNYNTDSDDRTVAADNSTKFHQSTHPTPTHITYNAQANDEPAMGISDSGATGHFLVADAPVTNKRIAKNPIKITLPDGNIISSSHTCNLNIPWLPDAMTAAHIVPGLSHASLLATRQFCDAGCKVTFDHQYCTVIYKGDTVLQGGRDPKTKLWTLPINPKTATTTTDTTTAAPWTTDMANTAYTMPTKPQAVQFMHQTLFCPPTQTLIKAINNGQLKGFPHMTADNVRKHLKPSPATTKGRLKMNKQGIRSTKPSQTRIPAPPQANHIFCFSAMADKTKRTLYHDLTGRLPVMSLEGNQYFFVAYDYTLNAILVRPTKDLASPTIIEAFDSIFTELKAKGFKPQLNSTDNQAVAALKDYLATEHCEWQFVEPNNHRVNAAERAIQTFKNHFISGLCTTDSNFPLQLWDQLAVQAQDTLNLLRTSRHDPSKSAYEALNGAYDFKK